MKKLAKVIATGVLSVTLFGGVAGAQAATCSLSNTGPGSNNTCTVSNVTTVTVTCVNGVDVTNTNIQNAASGTATVSGNTISGSATSGSTANLNATANDLAQFCLAAAPVTPPTTPPAGGMGGGSVAAASTTVTALPKTGVQNILPVVAAGVAAVAAIIGVSQLVLAGYRRK